VRWIESAIDLEAKSPVSGNQRQYVSLSAWYRLTSGTMAQTTSQMIATAVCPQCRMRVWLLDAVRFIPGTEPDVFEGPDPVTFLHCGKTQSVSAASIRYKRSNVTEFGEQT
jgi:hypothetical protein